MNTPQVNITVTDLSFTVSSLIKGIGFVMGITKRGPVNDASTVIRTWPQFEALFGGFLQASDFPFLAKRALDKGAQLRVARIAHYTDATDASTLTAVKPSIKNSVMLTFSAALVALNQYDLTINGVAITPVVFAGSSDATMALISSSLSAHAAVGYATYVPAGVGLVRQILIFPADGVSALTLTTGGGGAGVVTLGVSQATVAKATKAQIVNITGDTLFSVASKYHGADYNNLEVKIDQASNGNSAYFNLSINHSQEPTLNRTYTNLTIPGNPTAETSTYLQDVIQQNELVDITYADLSGLTGQINPLGSQLIAGMTYYLEGGSNGDPVVVADYTGDGASHIGLHAFDAFDDSMNISAPEMSDATLHTSGCAYAASRKDLQYFAHISNGEISASDIITAKNTSTSNTPYAMFFAGGLKVLDPSTSLTKSISELGDIVGLAAATDINFGEWYSFSGPNRGVVNDALGVVNNFGGPASYNDLNALANAQVNVMIQRNNQVMLWGSFTSQLATSQMSLANITRLVIFIRKSIKPTLERYIEEPNDIPTWLKLYFEVKPFFDSLKSSEKRALFDYVWDGDQFAQNLDSLSINNKNEVGLGKYKVKLRIKAIASIQELSVNIELTPTGVNFGEIA